ncbi:MAG: hypothetical protein HYV34_02610 [Candidatus Kerfeldbacteria bacterium]|nr:hypothetical protein [Candidatus Kerfeldbacteria bacterium]
MTPTTRIIGLKEFRSNITSLWKEARKKKISYIVLNHSQPVLRVEPIFNDQASLDQLLADISEARKQVKEKKVISEKKLYKKLGQ